MKYNWVPALIYNFRPVPAARPLPPLPSEGGVPRCICMRKRLTMS